MVAGLEVFTEEGGKRFVHRSLSGSEAYDCWHLSYYYKEILTNRKRLKDKRPITISELRRKDRDIFSYAILANQDSLGLHNYLELGSTLFEICDGLRIVNRYLTDQSVDVSKDEIDLDRIISATGFYGIEISELFRDAAIDLNGTLNLTHFPSTSEFLASSVAKGGGTYLYDRAVAGYAFGSVSDYVDLLSAVDLAFSCSSLSRGGTVYSDRLGNRFTYFSIRELIARSSQPIWHIFGSHAPKTTGPKDLDGVIDCFCIYGSRDLAEYILETVIRYAPDYVRTESMAIKPIESLLGGN